MMKKTTLTEFALALVLLTAVAAAAAEPIEIGSRRELFVDNLLIEKLDGQAALKVHQPEPQEVVLVTDKPWEGNTCAYYTIFQDGDLYRMYYRGSHYDTKTRKVGSSRSNVLCRKQRRYSLDEARVWVYSNSRVRRENNIVWDGIGTHCFVAFKDENPDLLGRCPLQSDRAWPTARRARAVCLQVARRPALVAAARQAGDYHRGVRFAKPGVLGSAYQAVSRVPPHFYQRCAFDHDRHVAGFHSLDRAGFAASTATLRTSTSTPTPFVLIRAPRTF